MFVYEGRKEEINVPNHIKNVVKIKGIPKDKIDYILNKVAVKYKSEMTGNDEWIMDFDLVIPEPRFKKDCPKQFYVNSESHVKEDEARPWFNWYDWHCTYWGTKWNAYDGYTKIGKTQLTFVFSTAWSAPFPVYTKLCELGYDLDIRYADEDIGANCGQVIYNAKEDDVDHFNSMHLSNPERFARYIWDNY